MKLGVTGHQELGENYDWVEESVRQYVAAMKPSAGYSCLAKGADQIFATICIAMGVRVVPVIAARNIEESFSDMLSLKYFKALLEECDNPILLRNESTSERAFFDAGIKVVDSVDTMIAVWDGCRSRGLGGTADVVAYALKIRVPVFHINPLSRICSRID